MPSITPRFSSCSRDQLILELNTSERSTFTVDSIMCWSPLPCTPVKTRCVKFDLQANLVHQVSTPIELSPEEIALRWYSDTDLRTIRSQQQILSIRCMKSGGRLDDGSPSCGEEYCFRGIYTATKKAKRRELQAKIYMELLSAPTDNYYCQPPETDVARKLQRISEKSVQTAIARARHDRIAALKAYR